MIIIQIIIKDNKTFIDSIFYNDSIELNVLLSPHTTWHLSPPTGQKSHCMNHCMDYIKTHSSSICFAYTIA